MMRFRAETRCARAEHRRQKSLQEHQSIAIHWIKIE
jgi:hypothetical protein